MPKFTSRVRCARSCFGQGLSAVLSDAIAFGGLPGQMRGVDEFDDGDVVRWRVLHIESHGGCGCQDVDVVAQTGDLPVAHGEHNDVASLSCCGAGLALSQPLTAVR